MDTWSTVFVGVQAFSAVVIVVLTWGLVSATKAYAKTASDQLDEMIRLREEEVRPYVHIKKVDPARTYDNAVERWGLVISLVNLGRGPALNLRGRFSHRHLSFGPNIDPMILKAGEEALLTFPPSLTVPSLPSGEEFPKDAKLELHYRDVIGYLCTTEVPLNLGYDRSGSNISNIGIATLDQRETFSRRRAQDLTPIQLRIPRESDDW